MGNDFLFIESELNGHDKELNLRIEVFDDDGKKGPDRKDKLLGSGFFSLKQLEAAALVKSMLPLSDGKRQKAAGQLLVRSFKEHQGSQANNGGMYGAGSGYSQQNQAPQGTGPAGYPGAPGGGGAGYPAGGPSYPPQPGMKPGGYPTAGGYPQGGGGYPQAPGYPQGGAGYPQASGGYPQSSGGYPQGGGGYPQAGAAYPQGGPSFPQSDPMYPPSN